MERLKISMVFVICLLTSLAPVSASLGNSMVSEDNSSLSNAFGATNSTNNSGGSLQLISENKSSIGVTLNETATQINEITSFASELNNALNNGTEVNITNQANQTYGNLIQIHNITELHIGDIISFRTNLTNPLGAVINLLLLNITENSFIFKMVNASDMKSFVNISVNRTALEQSWGNDTNTVIRPLQYNETQAEQFLLELSTPSNGTSSSGILDFITEHKALISGGAVAVLVVSGVALGIVMTCCSKKTTPHAEVTVLVRNVPEPVVTELVARNFLAEGEIALSDIWRIADSYFDENYIAEYGDKPYKTTSTKLEYKTKVFDLIKKTYRVKVVKWNKYEFDMKYSTIFDAEKACKEVFEKIIRK